MIFDLVGLKNLAHLLKELNRNSLQNPLMAYSNKLAQELLPINDMFANN